MTEAELGRVTAHLLEQLRVESSDFATPVVVRSPEFCKQLPSLEELDERLKHSMLRYPFALAYKNGQEDPPNLFTASRSTGGKAYAGYLQYSKAVSLIAAQHSMEFGAIDCWEPRIGSVAAYMAQRLGSRVDGQLFITPPNRQGLKTHRDRTVVIAAQLHGHKNWRVHEVPGPEAWTAGPAEHPGNLILERTLTPGDVLFMPVGCAHTVTAEKHGLSAHITFGVHLPNSRDVRSALMDRLRLATSELGRALTVDETVGAARILLADLGAALTTHRDETISAAIRGVESAVGSGAESPRASEPRITELFPIAGDY